MNTIVKTRNRLKQFLAAFGILALLLAGVFIFWQVRQQQETRGRASTVTWLTAQTATTSCGSSGTAVIHYTFTNTEPSRSMIVTVNDIQSSASAQLDLVAPGITKTGTLDTGLTSLSAGKVSFNLSWADDQSQTDTIPFSYSGVSCSGGAPVCSDFSHSVCSWDPLPGVSKYTVNVLDVNSGQTVTSATVNAPTTQLVFPSAEGKTYQCSVSAQNVCGSGDIAKSDKVTCTPQTPPVCSNTQGTCTWDALSGVTAYHVIITNVTTNSTVVTQTVQAPNTSLQFTQLPGDTYQCSVSAENVCGKGPNTTSDMSLCGPTPTPPVCTNHSMCTWDALPGASSYTVKVIDTKSGNTIKSGTVTAPNTSFDFDSQPGISYQCSVTPVNVCGNGPTTSGQPVTCGTPTPTPTGTLTPTPTPTVTPTPTPTVPVTGTPYPTNTPTPTPYPTATPTPTPTSTPQPTPTPLPTYTPIPTPTFYPTYTPAPTLTPVLIVRQSQPTIIYQPGQTVYVPGQTQYVQTPGRTVYTTPTPTMAATGAVQTTAIAAGVAAILVALGGVVFLIL